MVTSPLRCEGGYLLLPGAPGIGMELVPDAAERFPYVPKEVRTRLNAEGAVVDQ